MEKRKLNFTHLEKVVAEVKNALQLPKTTLEIMKKLKLGKRSTMSVELIDSALKSIDDAVRVLNTMVGW